MPPHKEDGDILFFGADPVGICLGIGIGLGAV